MPVLLRHNNRQRPDRGETDMADNTPAFPLDDNASPQNSHARQLLTARGRFASAGGATLPAPGSVLLAAALFFSCLMAACAPNSLYRDTFEVCDVSPDNGCDKYSIQQYNTGAAGEYLLAFVEIDDQGQLRDRAQMMAAIDTLYKTAAGESLLINVFVHGWHHNAAPTDANVASFRETLANLSEVEAKLSHDRQRARRKVVGVYVGWRGESVTIPYLKELTFWERKNTAQKVGHSGVTELLLRLEEISNVRNTMQPPIRSRLVVMGHSFGGAVVYSATSQILASRFIDSREQKGFTDTAKGFGDLVVLLNPAFEALRYSPLYDLAQSRCGYFDNQRPRLAILTSEADNATKIAFPAGRIFSTLFETHDTLARDECGFTLTLDESVADITTVGHFTPLISHTLTPAAGQKSPALVARYANAGTVWTAQKRGGATRFGSTILTHLDKTAARNPYLNVRVSKELIRDHNDIWRTEITDFLRLLIILSTWEEG